MDWKQVLQKAGFLLKDGAVEYIEQCCREEEHHAKEMQRESDILAAIMGFVDLKASDMTILELLQKYFGIDSISEGKQYIIDARIYYQCSKLKDYLGLSGPDWLRYKNEYAVLSKLKNNPKLLEMPVEKLITKIEKN